VRQLLYAHGDDFDPLPETVRVLDSITTDFIIESCHGAAAIATHAGRQKVKLEDFRLLFRKDAAKTGRMLQLETMGKEQAQQRKMFDVNNDRLEKGGFQVAEALGIESDDDEEEESHAGTGDAAKAKNKRKRAKNDDGEGSGKGKKAKEV